jgi:hypothetical protein
MRVSRGCRLPFRRSSSKPYLDHRHRAGWEGLWTTRCHETQWTIRVGRFRRRLSLHWRLLPSRLRLSLLWPPSGSFTRRWSICK